MEQILNTILNTSLLGLAVYVFLKYLSLSQQEESFGPVWSLMTGISLATLGIVFLRIYWMPWYWLPVLGISPSGLYKTIIAPSFQWVLWAGLLLSVLGLSMHIKVYWKPSTQQINA